MLKQTVCMHLIGECYNECILLTVFRYLAAIPSCAISNFLLLSSPSSLSLSPSYLILLPPPLFLSTPPSPLFLCFLFLLQPMPKFNASLRLVVVGLPSLVAQQHQEIAAWGRVSPTMMAPAVFAMVSEYTYTYA